MKQPISAVIYASLVLLLAGVCAPQAEAKRVTKAPPYMRRIIFGFSNKTPPQPADGSKMGAIMGVTVVLSNLSSIVQSGTLTLGGSAAAGEVNRSEPIAVHFSLCGDSSAGSDSPGMPAGVSFTLSPNETKSFSASALFSSSYNNAGPGGHTAFDAQFTPSITIEVDQDRGAVTGVLTPTWDGPVPGFSSCDGFSYSIFQTGMTDVSESRTGVPLLINGGRPF